MIRMQQQAIQTEPAFWKDALTKRLIESCLAALSVRRHLLGARYLKMAALRVHRAPNPYAVSMMRDVYPAIGDAYDTNAVMASRAMRHAIERAWKDGDRAVQRSYFGYSAADKRGVPTNAEFVYAVRERVRLLGG